MVDIFFPQGLFTIDIFVKIGVLIIMFLYVIFTFVVFNQVRVMNRIIILPTTSTLLFVVATIFLLGGISLFLLAAVIL